MEVLYASFAGAKTGQMLMYKCIHSAFSTFFALSQKKSELL